MHPGTCTGRPRWAQLPTPSPLLPGKEGAGAAPKARAEGTTRKPDLARTCPNLTGIPGRPQGRPSWQQPGPCGACLGSQGGPPVAPRSEAEIEPRLPAPSPPLAVRKPGFLPEEPSPRGGVAAGWRAERRVWGDLGQRGRSQAERGFSSPCSSWGRRRLTHGGQGQKFVLTHGNNGLGQGHG